ncbi:unnamed protein product [Pleuronectes platessa]|uniref:Uncharacterized protein n=1 Tax=Pleuronectes platessa TaxID=8262 RepID=A0A9N7TW36_PLEPL|nr:unnamed protein product [Pleuronectes platessa]
MLHNEKARAAAIETGQAGRRGVFLKVSCIFFVERITARKRSRLALKTITERFLQGRDGAQSPAASLLLRAGTCPRKPPPAGTVICGHEPVPGRRWLCPGGNRAPTTPDYACAMRAAADWAQTKYPVATQMLPRDSP